MQIQNGTRDVIARKKLLPPGEWKRSIWPTQYIRISYNRTSLVK